jgi:hypothetical protein
MSPSATAQANAASASRAMAPALEEIGSLRIAVPSLHSTPAITTIAQPATVGPARRSTTQAATSTPARLSARDPTIMPTAGPSNRRGTASQ